MLKTQVLLTLVVLSVFSFSTVTAQNVAIEEVSKSLTESTHSKSLKGIRDLTIQSGTSSTGGGGVRTIKTDSFPDKEKLSRAIEIITARIAAVDLPRGFKTAVIDELNYLYQNDLIRAVPALLIHVGEDEFRSYSGKSRNEPRKQIILSWFEHSQKSDEDSASNILHEILHNISSESLTADEKYIEDLEQAIMKGTSNSWIKVAIESGIYLGHGIVHLRQFYDLTLDVNHPSMRQLALTVLSPFTGKETPENKEAIDKAVSVILEYVKSSLARIDLQMQPGSRMDYFGGCVYRIVNSAFDSINNLYKSKALFIGLKESTYHFIKESNVTRMYDRYDKIVPVIAEMLLEKVIEFNPQAAQYKSIRGGDKDYGCTKYKESGWFSSEPGRCEEWIPLKNYLVPEEQPLSRAVTN